jgi:aryl-alcohol dehydrogenase-like predicted oxidoreductase
MEYRLLGNTGVKVSARALGTMMFGHRNTDEESCKRILDQALDAGINFIDTADHYADGRSEEIVGPALGSRRNDVILSSKVHFPVGEDAINKSGNSRYWIFKAVEGSLRRLGVDHIDLLHIHRPDFQTDISETLRALTDIVRQGKVRYIASSTFPAFHVNECAWLSEQRGLERFVAEQLPYSILVRHNERDVFKVLSQKGMGAITYSPLAGGWLTGKYKRGVAAPAESRANTLPATAARFDPSVAENQRKFDVIDDLNVVAAEAGLSLANMAIAFAAEHPAVSSVLMGPRTEEQMTSLLESIDLRLDAATLDAIDACVRPGETLNPLDRAWQPPWLASEARRRPGAHLANPQDRPNEEGDGRSGGLGGDDDRA